MRRFFSMTGRGIASALRDPRRLTINTMSFAMNLMIILMIALVGSPLLAELFRG